MRNENLKTAVLEKLQIGAENGVHMAELAEQLGVSTRRVRALTAELRREGVEIISGGNGYYFAKDDTERRRFIKTMQRRGISHFASSKTTRRKLLTGEGQMALDLEVQEHGQKKKT